MLDIESLIRRVKRNCDVSDARHWGTYSLCGLLLRLRELYRSEKKIRPWEKILQNDIGEWIASRETLWKELEDEEIEGIPLDGVVREPFDVEKINAVLGREGLVYGAGFGLHGKPSFFLADLVSTDRVKGCTVFMAGSEYARDLADYPAMAQDGSVFVRADMTKLLLWNRFEELRFKKSKCALSFAFSHYGIDAGAEPSEEVDLKISLIASSEVETFMHHELGEVFEGEKIGAEWKTLIASLPTGRSELFARSVKDVLSDTSAQGMLSHIIRNRKAGSLGFYIVFLSGLRKLLFPEIREAFEAFLVTGDWEGIEAARTAGYERAGIYVEKILSIYRSGVSNGPLSERIELDILSGLQLR
ncbi:MAG: Sfum_1244 family protein [Nitrospirota bacterium]